MTIEQLIRRYVASPRYSNLSISSQEAYKYAMKNLVGFFGDKDIAKIKRSDFVVFQEKRANTPGMANLCCRVASVIFEYAVDIDLLPFNPAARIKKLPEGSRTKWTPKEVSAGIAGAPDRAVAIAIALAWYTGQRESDILQMRWSDIEDGYMKVIQKKTGLEMRIKLHPDLVLFLEGMRDGAADTDYIVSGTKPLSCAAFRGRFRRRMDNIDIFKTFHGVRKGVASSVAEKGGTTKEIAAILGHKTLRMAAYYSDQADHTVLAESAVDNLVGVL